MRRGEEEASCARLTDHPFQRGDRQVRLPKPGIAEEQQPLVDDRKRVAEGTRTSDRVHKGVVVGFEILQIALLVERWNPRVRQDLVADAVPPAVTANDPADSLFVDRLPAGIVAERTGHGEVRKENTSKMKS